MPELPWEKWYPTNWASEPGLRLCEAATRGIWFEAVNTMMLNQTASISGTLEQLAALCICRTSQMQLAVEQIKTFNVAKVEEHNGNITLTNRRRLRDCNIRDLRRKAGLASATKRQHHPQHAAPTPSAYASTSSSTDGGFGGKMVEKPDLEAIRLHCAKIGLSEAEGEHFFNYYESNGWRVGRNPMRSWTHALVNWKINAKSYGNNRNQTDKPNPRNTGVIVGPTDYAHAKPRLQRELEEAERAKLAGQVVANADNQPATGRGAAGAV